MHLRADSLPFALVVHSGALVSRWDFRCGQKLKPTSPDFRHRFRFYALWLNERGVAPGEYASIKARLLALDTGPADLHKACPRSAADPQPWAHTQECPALHLFLTVRHADIPACTLHSLVPGCSVTAGPVSCTHFPYALGGAPAGVSNMRPLVSSM